MSTVPGAIHMLIRTFAIILFVLSMSSWAYDLNDGHIHYNQDVWNDLPAEGALRLLIENGIQRAIVSSTPTAGTEILYRLSPERIIPFLRPYRIYRDRYTWHSDPTIVDYIKQQLATGIYQGFGEFHLFKRHKDSPVVQQLMQIVADHQLMVSAHSDAETIEALINMQPNVTLIWAHCGMDHPVDDVRQLLELNPSLNCELSFRHNMMDEEDKLLNEWKTLLEQYPERFILGMDTYIPKRWASLPEHAQYAQHWLSQLNSTSAKLIAKGNIDRLFPLKR